MYQIYYSVSIGEMESSILLKMKDFMEMRTELGLNGEKE